MTSFATVLIDDQKVDARLVTAQASSSGSPACRIEVRIPSHVVLHELQQSCDPMLTRERLGAFLVEDARSYRAREAYIAIAVSVATSPRRDRLTMPHRWNWSSTLEVRELDGHVHFIGTAIPL